MRRAQLLLLPGSTSPILTDKYRAVYDDISASAQARGFNVQLIVYPGQRSGDRERVSFQTACESAEHACAALRPRWVIGRSFGCLVATALAGSGGSWLDDCDGMTLWGPCLGRTVQGLWGTEESEQRAIAEYEKFGTRLAVGFFREMPAIEVLIKDAQCSLRIIRGAHDEFSTDADVAELVSLHRAAQSGAGCTSATLWNLNHHVTRASVSPAEWALYCDVLFCSSGRGAVDQDA